MKELEIDVSSICGSHSGKCEPPIDFATRKSANKTNNKAYMASTFAFEMANENGYECMSPRESLFSEIQEKQIKYISITLTIDSFSLFN